MVLVLVAASAGAVGLHAQMTEEPQTIEPGRALVRMDAITLGIARNTAAPFQYNALALGTGTVSYGITDTLDIGVGAQLYLRDTVNVLGQNQTHSGIGAVTLRTKWEFLKDQSSGQQAAIIPYVILPTHSNVVGNNAVQGGVILPWTIDLAAGIKFGAQFEWDELRNAANTRYDTRWYGSCDVKWELGRLLGVYAEATLSDSTAGSSTFAGTVGGGATLSLSNNFQWDFEMSKVVGPNQNPWTKVVRFNWKI
ncbi:MAG: transporter [Opitutales bacterium]